MWPDNPAQASKSTGHIVAIIIFNKQLRTPEGIQSEGFLSSISIM
jgi:hypothetical protein